MVIMMVMVIVVIIVYVYTYIRASFLEGSAERYSLIEARTQWISSSLQQEQNSLSPIWKATSIALIGILMIVSLTLTTVFYDVVIINQEALKVLVQAEATILGFFGLIIVYILKAFDERQEWWESLWYEVQDKGKGKKTVEVTGKSNDEFFSGFINALVKKRQSTVRFGSIIATLLVFSLLLSVFLLGITSTVIVGVNVLLDRCVSTLGGFAVYCLFLATVYLVELFKIVPELL